MKRLGCSYCEGQGPEPGTLWMDNNGPIVDCPICNDNSPAAKRERDYEAALRQRDAEKTLASVPSNERVSK
jgi:hypothetical protein